jgi:hypothetical protein
MTPELDFMEVDFSDKRLKKRLMQFIENSRKNAKESILGSTKERNSAKAFYRLLSNDKFDFAQMQESVKNATISRMTGTVLLIQDTSDLNLNGHKKTEGLGYCSEHVRGIKLHNCIAISPEGLPIGLAGQYYETRKEAKSKLSKVEKTARPIEEKESYRWLEMLMETTKDIPKNVNVVTICDREGDFYELYAKALELSTDFIVRVTHNRSSEDNEKTADKIRKTKAIGKITVNIPRDSRSGAPARQTEMEIAYCQVRIPKPTNVQDDKIAKNLQMNLVRITELTPPSGQKPIEWILATNIPLFNDKDAMKIVEYYVQRWKIERFHFVLKSGCNAQKIQQRTFERIKPVLLIYSVIAIFIMAVTYMGRISPDIPCNVFFEEDEWKILYRIIRKTKTFPDKPYSMATAIMYLGQLGGYKRAPSDGLPGLKTIWLGLFALYNAIDLLMGQV